MKKFSFLFMLLTGLLLLAGCSSDSSNPEPIALSGVVGQISGLLVNNITGLPIQGAAVQLREQRATTDANGFFMLKNVPAGDHYVTFRVNGYRFETRNLIVDPGQYFVDDPFLEKWLLDQRVDAINAWIQSQDLTQMPDSDWTYVNGVWKNKDGMSMSVNMDSGVFEFTNKVDYGIYNYFNTMNLIQLAPLTGGAQGSIELVDSNRAAPKPIIDDVEIWIVDEYSAVYGPVKTKDGGFSFTGLPAGVLLTVKIQNFTHDGYYYSGTIMEQFNGYNFTTFGNFTIPTQSFDLTLDVIYLGGIEGYEPPVYITAADLGNRSVGKKPEDSLSLTFDKEIYTANIAFALTMTNVKAPASGTITFDADWSAYSEANGHKVTLTPSSTGGLLGKVLPYSTVGTTEIGALIFNGSTVDGEMFNNNRAGGIIHPDKLPNANLNVYTEEGLKLLFTDIAPSDIPAARTLVSADAIKFVFNKPLSSENVIVRLTSSSGAPVDYTIKDNNLFVWTDWLHIHPHNIYYSVAAKDDINDAATGTTTAGFTAIGEQGLAFKETNIYAAYKGFDPISSATADFAVNGVPSFTFHRAVPAGAVVEAGFVNVYAWEYFNTVNLADSLNALAGNLGYLLAKPVALSELDDLFELSKNISGVVEDFNLALRGIFNLSDAYTTFNASTFFASFTTYQNFNREVVRIRNSIANFKTAVSALNALESGVTIPDSINTFADGILTAVNTLHTNITNADAATVNYGTQTTELTAITNAWNALINALQSGSYSVKDKIDEIVDLYNGIKSSIDAHLSNFNNYYDGKSLTDYYISGDEIVAFTSAYNAGRTQITFTPSAALKAGNEYVLAFSIYNNKQVIFATTGTYITAGCDLAVLNNANNYFDGSAPASAGVLFTTAN